jgi:hypothetical protein
MLGALHQTSSEESDSEESEKDIDQKVAVELAS